MALPHHVTGQLKNPKTNNFNADFGLQTGGLLFLIHSKGQLEWGQLTLYSIGYF